MNSATCYLRIALLICAAGQASVHGFDLLKKTPARAVSAAAAILPPQKSAAAFGDQSALLDIPKAPNEPIKVVNINIDETGDLIIEAENISPQPVTFIMYYLAPADCPKSVKPAAFLIVYGSMRNASGGDDHKTDPPIKPGGRTTLTIAQKIYKGILDFQKSANCSSSAKPRLTLSRVIFSDRSEWQGFADGADHTEWNGRFLKPDHNK